jgi:hypothetical protein
MTKRDALSALNFKPGRDERGRPKRRAPKKATAQLHVRIDPVIYRALKVRAAETGVKLQDLVADFLAYQLKHPWFGKTPAGYRAVEVPGSSKVHYEEKKGGAR